LAAMEDLCPSAIRPGAKKPPMLPQDTAMSVFFEDLLTKERND
jgi:hypothetical protein